MCSYTHYIYGHTYACRVKIHLLVSIIAMHLLLLTIRTKSSSIEEVSCSYTLGLLKRVEAEVPDKFISDGKRQLSG